MCGRVEFWKGKCQGKTPNLFFSGRPERCRATQENGGSWRGLGRQGEAHYACEERDRLEVGGRSSAKITNKHAEQVMLVKCESGSNLGR